MLDFESEALTVSKQADLRLMYGCRSELIVHCRTSSLVVGFRCRRLIDFSIAGLDLPSWIAIYDRE